MRSFSFLQKLFVLQLSLKHFFSFALIFSFSAPVFASLIQTLPTMSLGLREGKTKSLGLNGSHYLQMGMNGNLLLRKKTGEVLWSTGTAGKCTQCFAQFRSTGFLVVLDVANKNSIIYRVGYANADSIEFHSSAPYVRIKKADQVVWTNEWKENRSLDQLLKETRVGSNSFYSLRDHAGRSLDALEIEQEDANRLVGLYHTLIGPDKFCLRVATAQTLAIKTWQHVNDIDCDYASQGELKRLPDGKYLMAYEKNPTGRRPYIRFRFYDSYQALLANQYSRQFDAPMTAGANADGTPNFRWIRYSGNPDTMTVEIGFHYNRSSDSRDINAIGFMRGFQSFDSYTHTALNDRLSMYAGWHLGDRTFIQYQGRNYTLVEAMTVKNDWNSWRLFLYDEGSGHIEPISFATPLNSPSHGNPSLRFIQIGEVLHLVGTNFIFETAEGGAHLFMKPLAYGVNSRQSLRSSTIAPEYDVHFRHFELRHHIGRAEADGWSVVAGEQGHMIFGPYVRTLPHAPMAVNFVYMVDNNTAENHEVVSFDVYDATTGEILAHRTLRRQELPTPFTWGVFSLGFDMRGRAGHAIEARIYSHGISYIKFSYLSFVD